MQVMRTAIRIDAGPGACYWMYERRIGPVEATRLLFNARVQIHHDNLIVSDTTLGELFARHYRLFAALAGEDGDK